MKSDHEVIAATYWLLRKIISPFIKYFLIKEVSGLGNIPKSGAAILAFNHQSIFDFLCVAAVAPRNIHFLSAEKFFQHPWWKIVMTLTGQIMVRRDEHDKIEVHDAVEAHARRGNLIGIFPEGTRSPYEDRMLKAFTGVAQFALKHSIPVIPVGIVGTYKVMAKHDTRARLNKIVSIKFGEPLNFKEHHHKHADREICIYVTENVIGSITKLSGKKYEHYESRHK